MRLGNKRDMTETPHPRHGRKVADADQVFRTKLTVKGTEQRQLMAYLRQHGLARDWGKHAEG